MKTLSRSTRMNALPRASCRHSEKPVPARKYNQIARDLKLRDAENEQIRKGQKNCSQDIISSQKVYTCWRRRNEESPAGGTYSQPPQQGEGPDVLGLGLGGDPSHP